MPRDTGAVAWLMQHPEDIPLARENLACRDKGFDDDGVRALWATVCLEYCKDFKNAFLMRNRERMKECHEFFKGDIFQFYVNELISPEEVESRILQIPIEKIKEIWANYDKPPRNFYNAYNRGAVR